VLCKILIWVRPGRGIWGKVGVGLVELDLEWENAHLFLLTTIRMQVASRPYFQGVMANDFSMLPTVN